MSLKSAVTQLGIEVSVDDIHRIENRTSYPKMVWSAKHQLALELGGDPELSKQAGIGHLLIQADALDKEGQHDKAAEVWFKIAKLAGWTSDSQINIFGDLSQADFDRIKERLKQNSADANSRPN